MRILSFLHNIWRYRGFLWEDRDWDYYYTLNILRIKLQYQYDYLTGPKGHAIHSKTSLKKLKRLILLLNRELAINEADPLSRFEVEFNRIYGLDTGNTLLNLRELSSKERKYLNILRKRDRNRSDNQWDLIWKDLKGSIRSYWD